MISWPSPRPLARWPAAVAAVATALVAVIWLTTWQRAQLEERQALKATANATSNLVIAFEEQTIDAFEDVDQGLRLIQSGFLHDGLQGAAALIEDWPLNRELVRKVSVLRDDGTPAIERGDDWAAGQGEKDELEFHRERPGTGALHIGRPVKDPVADTWRVPVSRRINTLSGGFAGIALAMVDPAFINRLIGHVDLGSSGVVSVVGVDGIALVRQTGPSQAFGVDMHASTLMERALRSPSGTFVGAGKIDGVPRLYSYRALEQFPLVVMVGVARADALASAAARARLYYFLAAIATCVVVLVTTATARSIRRQKHYVGTIEAARSRLSASEANMHAITESMAGGVVRIDARGAILSVNKAACAMFGYAADDIVGQHISKLVHESRYTAVAAVFRELKSRHGEFKDKGRESVAVRSDGTAFEVEVMISSLVKDGTCTFIGIVHDISERKRMERELRANEARLRVTFDQALIGIAHSDLAGRYFKVNQAFCEMLGYSEKELLERRYIDVTHPEDILASQTRGAQLLLEPAHMVQRPVTKRYIHKNGALVWALMSLTLIHNEAGEPEHYVTMIQDITELKRAEQMKNEFVSTVSHELRTPLTSISASLGLVAGGVAGELPAPARELVAIATRNCARLLRLVSDILDTEKLDAGKMSFDLRVADLGPLVDHAVECNLGFAREHGVEVAFTAPAGPLQAKVDADRFNQVVTNLLSNAIKFSPRGGVVEMALVPRRGAARIEVRDHGPGIPAEFHSRIFQRFSQADSSNSRQGGGTGLGLSIAKAIVERLGGTIGFITNPGEGTTFHVELPLAVPRSAETRRIATTVEA